MANLHPPLLVRWNFEPDSHAVDLYESRARDWNRPGAPLIITVHRDRVLTPEFAAPAATGTFSAWIVQGSIQVMFEGARPRTLPCLELQVIPLVFTSSLEGERYEPDPRFAVDGWQEAAADVESAWSPLSS